MGTVTSVAQVAVDSEHSAFLEPLADVRVARVRQQSVHLGIEPAPKDVPRVVGPVGQIRVGRTGFAVDLECEICGSIRVHRDNRDVEVEEVHLAVPILVKSVWVDSVLSRCRALPF